MNFKKYLTLALSLVMLLSLAACKKDSQPYDPDRNANQADGVISGGAFNSGEDPDYGMETIDGSRPADDDPSTWLPSLLESHNTPQHEWVYKFLNGSLQADYGEVTGSAVYGMKWKDDDGMHVKLVRYEDGGEDASVDVDMTGDGWESLNSKLEEDISLIYAQDGPFVIFNAAGMSDRFPGHTSVYPE